MLGLFGGTRLLEFVLGDRAGEPRFGLAVLLLVHLASLGWAWIALAEPGYPALAFALATAGLLVGGYFPIAAARLQRAGRSPGRAGARPGW